MLEQTWDVGFWEGCDWLTPGSCQAPIELLPQHHPQGMQGTRARKLLDQNKVGLRGEGKRKIQEKQRAWPRQLPSQPLNNLHLGCQTLFLLLLSQFLMQQPEHWCVTHSFSPKSKIQHHTGCHKVSQHHSSQTLYLQ